MAIHHGMEAWEATGARIDLPFFFSLLAESHLLAGQTSEGLTAVSDGLAIVERQDEHLFESELYRWRGELLLRLNPPDLDGAAKCFHRALAIATTQHALSLELRAACQRFIEGLDEPDLREAKGLLDSLA